MNERKMKTKIEENKNKNETEACVPYHSQCVASIAEIILSKPDIYHFANPPAI